MALVYSFSRSREEHEKHDMSPDGNTCDVAFSMQGSKKICAEDIGVGVSPQLSVLSSKGGWKRVTVGGAESIHEHVEVDGDDECDGADSDYSDCSLPTMDFELSRFQTGDSLDFATFPEDSNESLNAILEQQLYLEGGSGGEEKSDASERVTKKVKADQSTMNSNQIPQAYNQGPQVVLVPVPIEMMQNSQMFGQQNSTSPQAPPNMLPQIQGNQQAPQQVPQDTSMLPPPTTSEGRLLHSLLQQGIVTPQMIQAAISQIQQTRQNDMQQPQMQGQKKMQNSMPQNSYMQQGSMQQGAYPQGFQSQQQMQQQQMQQSMQQMQQPMQNQRNMYSPYQQPETVQQVEERMRMGNQMGFMPEYSQEWDKSSVCDSQISRQTSTARQPRVEREHGVKVFVGGLAPSSTSKGLREYFIKFGRILDAAVLADGRTKRSRGFGFVEFAGKIPDGLCDRDHIIEKRRCGVRPYTKAK